MAFIPVPGAAMVELFMRLDGQRIENVLYFRQAGSYDETELGSLAAEVRDWYVANILNYLSSNLSLYRVKATSLESETAPAIETGASLPASGGSGNAAIANNVALCIKFSTAGRGRSSRGRNFIPGIPAAEVAQNLVSPTMASNLLGGYEILQDAGVITIGAHCVVSRYLDKVARSPGVAQLVTGYSFTDHIVDSQRRRLPGRGT